MITKSFEGYLLTVSTLTMLLTLLFNACVHEPVIGPEDTSNGPPPSSDTVKFVINTKPCDVGKVYFENQVLPIFIANCAISGCHDQGSAEEGVILTNYQNIMKGIKPNNISDSEYYKVLISNNSEDLMPRKPGTEQGYRLPQDQIDIVKTWIEQGAQNNFCDACDTTEYTFNATIFPIISRNCATSSSCHGTGSKNGVFTSYSGIKPRADNGLLEQKTIIYKDMPPASPLPDCEMLLIKKWLDAGAQNN